jgi:hypothetical protein
LRVTTLWCGGAGSGQGGAGVGVPAVEVVGGGCEPDGVFTGAATQELFVSIVI